MRKCIITIIVSTGEHTEKCYFLKYHKDILGPDSKGKAVEKIYAIVQDRNLNIHMVPANEENGMFWFDNWDEKDEY